MKKISILFLVMGLLACDDGNIDVPEFNFDNVSINNCGNIVLSKINEIEVLVIELNEDNTNNAFFTKIRENGEEFSLTEGGSNTVAYRTFDAVPTAAYFCQNIPPTSPNAINEWTGSGTLVVTTERSIDDDDTVAAQDEDRNNDGNFDNDDTDADTIADYIDFDDDDDGIETINEDIDGDGNPMNDDTDTDGIPNYLDNDDDGDGVLTAFESLGDSDLDTIPDYLDPDTAIVGDERILTNLFNETYTSSFTINLLQLINANGNNINFDVYDFGLKTVTVVKSGGNTQ